MPEMRLQQRWRDLGCKSPGEMRVQDAVEFVGDHVAQHVAAGYEMNADKLQDLAALIISKTGANSLILKPTVGGRLEPRLRDLPALVLETYQRGAANDGMYAASGQYSKKA